MPMVLCKQIFLLFFQEHSRPVLETASQTCFTFQHNEKKTDFQTLIVHAQFCGIHSEDYFPNISNHIHSSLQL